MNVTLHDTNNVLNWILIDINREIKRFNDHCFSFFPFKSMKPIVVIGGCSA